MSRFSGIGIGFGGRTGFKNKSSAANSPGPGTYKLYSPFDPQMDFKRQSSTMKGMAFVYTYKYEYHSFKLGINYYYEMSQ